MSGFKKVLLGCSVLFLVVVVIGGVIVGMNWETISSGIDKVKGAVGDIMTVQKEITQRYGTDTNLQIQNNNGVTSLGITLRNYSPPEGTGLEAEARKIATFAAGIPSVPNLADVITVYFEQASDVNVITYSKTASYSFPIKELLSSPAPPEDSANPPQ